MNEQLLELQPERIQPGIGIEAIAAMDGGEYAQEWEVPQARQLSPKIYVASLSDYNAGELHGAWIDADQEPEAIHAEVKTMLEASTEPDAEEWAIHDYEDFASIALGEWESFSTVARLGKALAEHGRPFAYWANYVGHIDAEQLERFEEAYEGVWESAEAYGREMMQETGIEDEIERLVRPHLSAYFEVNYRQFGEDCLSDRHVVRDGEGLHVFRVE